LNAYSNNTPIPKQLHTHCNSYTRTGQFVEAQDQNTTHSLWNQQKLNLINCDHDVNREDDDQEARPFNQDDHYY